MFEGAVLREIRLLKRHNAAGAEALRESFRQGITWAYPVKMLRTEW